MILGFDEDAFKKSVGVVFVVLLLAGFVPILGGLVRLVPTLKEIVLGTVVVAAFTGIEDTTEGIKFALVTGMLVGLVFFSPIAYVVGGVVGSSLNED